MWVVVDVVCRGTALSFSLQVGQSAGLRAVDTAECVFAADEAVVAVHDVLVVK